ncbi:F-box/FBD/LRR-repeat protein At1g13570 [Linum perenne]
MFIPLREAAKTSILSTTWKNMWMNLPSLVFDETFFKDNIGPSTIDKLMFDICRVLLLYRGPLRDFSLSIPLLGFFTDHIGQIMQFLPEKNIECLTLKAHDYKLPSCLFSAFSQHLKILRLSYCELPTTSSSCVSFKIFHMLTVLELRHVKVMDSSLTTLLSFKCRSLTSLTMVSYGINFQWYPVLVDAPKLDYLQFVGNFCYLHLEHTPRLKTAIIHKYFNALGDKIHDDDNYGSVFRKIWDGLAAVESLSLSGYFCQVTILFLIIHPLIFFFGIDSSLWSVTDIP